MRSAADAEGACPQRRQWPNCCSSNEGIPNRLRYELPAVRAAEFSMPRMTAPGRDRSIANAVTSRADFTSSQFPLTTLNGLAMFSWAMAAYSSQACRSWGPDDYMLFGLRGHRRIHEIPYMLAEQVTQVVACSAPGMILRASEQGVSRTCARQFDD